MPLTQDMPLHKMRDTEIRQLHIAAPEIRLVSFPPHP